MKVPGGQHSWPSSILPKNRPLSALSSQLNYLDGWPPFPSPICPLPFLLLYRLRSARRQKHSRLSVPLRGFWTAQDQLPWHSCLIRRIFHNPTLSISSP